MISYPYILALEGFAVLVVAMFCFWLLSLAIKNASVVDIGWALGLVFLAWFYVHKGPGNLLRSALILLMVTVWGMRLCALLVIRLMRDPVEDKRYQKIRSDWGPGANWKFLALFEFEALLDVLLSLPFFLIAIDPSPRLGLFEITGILLWITGLIGETLADEQLKKFKADPANKARTCDKGLWYFSRHPNYFFEWLMWVGYFVFACASPWGWMAIISPLIMLHVLLNVSGVPLSEAQALATRGENYRRYLESTSLFVPLPKRKVFHD